MKRAFFVVLACACSAHSRGMAVEIAAPLASTTTAPVHDEVAIPKGSRRVAITDEAPWAADFAPSKKYAAYDTPSARRALLTWQIGKSHVSKSDDGEDETDSEYIRTHTVTPIDLVVRARGETRTISFGELAGSIEPAAISFCAKNTSWQSHPSFAAKFSIGLMQGDDDMVILHDAKNGTDTLHVLHRETSDGSCEDGKQGPLDICEGFQWERVADVRLAPGTELWETVELEGKTFDCSME